MTQWLFLAMVCLKETNRGGEILGQIGKLKYIKSLDLAGIHFGNFKELVILTIY